MGTIEVFYDQFAAVVLLRLRQKQRNREIGADAQPGQAVSPHRIVDTTIADCAPAVERPSSGKQLKVSFQTLAKDVVSIPMPLGDLAAACEKIR